MLLEIVQSRFAWKKLNRSIKQNLHTHTHTNTQYSNKSSSVYLENEISNAEIYLLFKKKTAKNCVTRTLIDIERSNLFFYLSLSGISIRFISEYIEHVYRMSRIQTTTKIRFI